MIALIFLLSALALGTALTRRLGRRLYAFEAAALSVALGLVLWTWLSFLLALLLPSNLSTALTVILSLAAAVILWRQSPAWRWKSLDGGRRAWAAWGIFNALGVLLIVPLRWSHDLLRGPDGALYSANATWADFGMHASLISHFAQSPKLPLDLPVAAGTHLTYPFMVDLLSGWLVYGGWTLHAAIFIPSVLLIFAFFQLIMGFGLRLFGGLAGSLIGLTFTLFSGSAVGLFTAYQDYKTSGLPLGAFLGRLPQDYTTLNVPNAQMSNFLADILLPQRAFVMGAAAFAAILVLILHLRRRSSRGLTIFLGLLVGLLPLVHAHSFLVLGAILAALWIESLVTGHGWKNHWLAVGLIALAVAAPQLLWQSLANANGTGGHLALGWTLAPGESLISFWLHNYGLTALLIIGTAWVLFTMPHLRRFLPWYAPLLAIFALANIYSLQPFAYDNHKLIMYVYLFTYLFAGYGAVWLVRRYRPAFVPAVLAALLLCGSGALAVAREFQHHDLFASADDVALADWVQSYTAPSDVFAATDRPNQPIATLGGRPIISGYRGWLYSYHLDYAPRLMAISEALQGRPAAASAYGARYVAVSAYEPAEWTVDRAALATTYIEVYRNPSWTVYRLP